MDFTLALPDVMASQGDQICLPLTTANWTDLLGMQFSVNYDPAALSYVEARNFFEITPFPNSSALQVANPSAGNLTFTWNDPTALGVTLPDGTTLLELCFTVTGTSTTTVSFSGTPTAIEVTDVNEVTIPFNGDNSTVTIEGGGGGTPTGFTLLLPDVMASQGDQICLPLTTANWTDLLGMQFSVNYNPAALSYVEARNFFEITPFPNSSALQVANPSAGNLTFTWNDPTALGVTLPDGTTLLELCFTVTGTSTTTVSFSGTPTAIEVTDVNEVTIPFNGDNSTVTIEGGGGGTPTGFTLLLPDVTASQGDQICLPLTTANWTDLLGMQFSVNYNPAALSYVEARNFFEITPFPNSSALQVANPSAGNLTFTWNDPTALGVTLPDGTTLLELCFTVTGTSTTTVSFSGTPTAIEVTDVNEVTIPFNGDNSTVTIEGGGGGTPTGFTLLLPDVMASQGDQICLPLTTANWTDLLGMQFSVNYNPAALSYVEARNFFEITPFPNSSALQVANPSAGNLTFTWNDPTALGVTLPDGTTLLELCFTVTGTSTTTVSFSGTPTAIEVTDVNEVTIPFNGDNSTVTIEGGGGGPPTGFTLLLPDVMASQGDQICLPLTTANWTDLLGMQFSVNYDPAALSYVEARNFFEITPFPNSSALQVANPSAGNLTFTWNDPTALGVTLPDGTTLLELCFTVTGTSTTTVSFSGTPTAIEVTDVNEVTIPFSSVGATITIGGTPPVNLRIGSATTMPGTSFCVPVLVTNFSDVQSLQFSLLYDSNSLTFDGTRNYNMNLANFNADSIIARPPDTILVNWMGMSGVTLTNNATLFELCFTANESGTTTIRPSGVPQPIGFLDSGDETLPVSTSNGTITVGMMFDPDDFVLTLADTNAETGDQVCLPLTTTNWTDLLGLQFSVNYDPAALTFVEARNFFEITPFPNSSALQVANPSAGNLTFTWNDPTAAGSTLPDGTVLLELCFNVTTDAATTVVFSAMPTAIEVTDVNEDNIDFNGDDAVVTIGGMMGPLPLTLSAGTASVMEGGNVCVPVRVNNGNFTDITDLQFSLNFDNSIVGYTGAQNFNANLPGLGAGSITNPSAGSLVVSWSNVTGVTLANGSILFELCFDGTAVGTSSLDISGMPSAISVMNGSDEMVSTSGTGGSVTVNGAFGPDDFVLTLADTNAETGDQVCLPLTTTNWTDLLGLQFSVNYDPAALTFVEARNFFEITPFPNSSALQVANPSAGNLTFTWNDPTAAGSTLPDGTVLLELCFNVTTDATTTVVFSAMPTAIEVTDVNEDNIDFNGDDAVVTIGGMMGPLPLTLSAGTASVMEGGNVCVPVRVSNGNFIDITDLQFSLNFDNSIVGYTGAQNFNANLPGLGAGSITNPSAGNLVVSWSNITGVTLANGSILFELCFDGTAVGTSSLDISGMPSAISVMNGSDEMVSTSGTSGSVTVNGIFGPDDFVLTLADVEAENGDQVCLPLTTTNWTDLLGLQFSANYDPAALTFVEARNFFEITPFPNSSALQVANPSAGNLTFTWNDPTAAGSTLPDGTVLLELCFNVTTDATTTVVFSAMPTAIEVTDVNEDNIDFNGDDGVITIGSTVEPDPLIVAVGSANVMLADAFCLPINVTNFTDLTDVQFSLNYDASLLQYTTAQTFNASVPGFGAASVTNPSMGNLVISWNNAMGVTLPSGELLLELCFTAQAPGTSTVEVTGTPTAIAVTNASTQSVQLTPNNGTVMIAAPPGEFAAAMGTAEACDGENFCSSVVASSFSNIQGMEFSINYDPAVLTLSSTTQFNSNLTGFGAEDLTTAAGSIVVDWDNGGGNGVSLSPSSVLFTVCFDKTGDSEPVLAISGSPTPINITDSNGDAVTYSGASTTITCNPIPDLSIVDVDIVNLNCADECVGAITLTTLTGSGEYSYAWSVAGAGDAPMVEGLCARSVTVTVTDVQTQQTVMETYTITSPPALTGMVTNINNVFCAGSTTGSITVSASGGNPLPGATYNFNWSGDLPDNVLTQSNLGEGTYSVTITDANGCTEVLNNIEVNELSGPLVSSGVVTNIGGPGLPGGIDLTATGGNGNNSYSWTGPNAYAFSGEDPDNITEAGTYTVTITDQFGCMAMNSFLVPEDLRINFFNIAVACAGEANGAIDITVAGGPNPGNYTYRWSGPGMFTADTEDLTDLAPGSYQVVINNGGESVTGTFEVATNPEIVLSGSTTIADLGNNGTIDLTASGGDGNLSFRWSTGATTEDLNGLQAGEYCVTVTDGKGCTNEACFTVVARVLTTVGTGSLVSCPDATDGCFTLQIDGGVGPYDIEISPGGFRTQVMAGPFEICSLAPGNYAYLVTDAQGTTSSNNFTVGTPDPIIVTDTVIVNDIVDAVGTGSISLTVTGGTGDLSYTWNSPGNGPAIFGLQGTTYNVTIQDENGCRVTESYLVGTLTDMIAITNAGCADGEDGQISVQVGGGDLPITFRWFGEEGLIPNASGSVLAGQAPGSYTVEITDGSGAIIQRSDLEIGVESDFTIATAVLEELTCHDSADGILRGSVVENNGTTGGFNYEWVNENDELIGTEATLSGVGAGRYTLTVIDDRMCEQVTVDSLVAPSAVGAMLVELQDIGCEGKDDGAIEVTGTGGTSSIFVYSWSNGAEGRRIANLPAVITP
jgi:hypothetical protein